jgi:CMP/dCMP kinase
LTSLSYAGYKWAMIIAIDGPSGAGKSTLGKMLARSMGFLYIDTGAMYRAAALAILQAGVDVEDADLVSDAVKKSHIRLEGDPDSLKVYLNGEDVSQRIRTEAVSRIASVISTYSTVRQELVARQREMGSHGSVVLDGRDIGTVVFPSADIKFFLTATPHKRAERRYLEDHDKDPSAIFEDTYENLIARDLRDTTRSDSPLMVAEDAIVIDSTDMELEGVFQRMRAVVDERSKQTRN